MDGRRITRSTYYMYVLNAIFRVRALYASYSTFVVSSLCGGVCACPLITASASARKKQKRYRFWTSGQRTTEQVQGATFALFLYEASLHPPERPPSRCSPLVPMFLFWSSRFRLPKYRMCNFSALGVQIKLTKMCSKRLLQIWSYHSPW